MTAKSPCPGKIGKIALLAAVILIAVGGVLIYGGNGNTLKAEEPAATEKAAAVEGDYGPRSVGSPDAPVVIEEFASFTCPHCAHFHTETYSKLKADYIDTGKVRFVFRDFPLNKPALDATMLARCLPADAYEGFAGLLFKTQEQWAVEDYLTHLRQDAKLAGMSDEAIDACLGNKAVQTAITDDMAAGQKAYEINSTPSFVLNGGKEKIGGAQPYETFRDAIEKLLAAGDTGKDTGKAE